MFFFALATIPLMLGFGSIVAGLGKHFTKVGRESQETFCNYRTMMSNFVEMLYRPTARFCALWFLCCMIYCLYQQRTYIHIRS